jgi:hypothetical protein
MNSNLEINIELIRYLAFISVIIYFCFDYFDSKRIKDEREELIKLKTFEFSQKVALAALTLLSASLMFFPALPGYVAILIFVFAFMYAEIFGKLYFRRKY